jgi:pimeloyl-ACP methyl ester carboxylesterase
MLDSVRLLLKKLKLIRPLHVALDIGDRHNPTIVLLHGIAATSGAWNNLVKDLDDKKYRIIALDLLGFGQSPRPFGCRYDVDDHVVYIRKTLKKLKVRKPYRMVGHSMGSIIAARYGRLYQKDLKEEYLLSLPIYLDGEHEQTPIARKRTDIYLNAYDFLMQNKRFTMLNSERLQKLLHIGDEVLGVNERNWDSFRLSLKNTIVNQNTYEDIQQTQLPIHVIYGSMDEFLIPEALINSLRLVRLKLLNYPLLITS